ISCLSTAPVRSTRPSSTARPRVCARKGWPSRARSLTPGCRPGRSTSPTRTATRWSSAPAWRRTRQRPRDEPTQIMIHAANIAPALLERWMREYYFTTEIDIGSSGVESFTLGEVRRLVGPTPEECDGVIFDDSRTQGAPGLRAAVARRWGVEDAGRVIATHGSSEAIYLVMH